MTQPYALVKFLNFDVRKPCYVLMVNCLVPMTPLEGPDCLTFKLHFIANLNSVTYQNV